MGKRVAFCGLVIASMLCVSGCSTASKPTTSGGTMKVSGQASSMAEAMQSIRTVSEEAAKTDTSK